ncbi:uncharacterized protein MONBRDRAFT_15420, partial [Monosiga brevicollis MX1]
IKAHPLPLTNIDVSKDGRRCVSASYDRTCILWDTTTGEELQVFEGHKNVVQAVIFNFPRCDHIISASFDRTARIHSVATGECRAVLKGHRGEILCVASDQQGDLVATGSLDHTVRLWDFATGDELHTLAGHTAEVVCVQFSADGVRLLSGSFDHTVILWNVATGRPVKTLLMHREAISRAELSFDGAWILSGSVDRTAILWNTDTGEPTGTCKMPSEVMSVAFSPSGRQCAMATATGVIRLYTTEPFTFRHELAEHRGEVSKVMFNATGTRLASICSDHTVRLWCTSTGTCVKVSATLAVFPHPDELIAIKFDYHADCFVTGMPVVATRLLRCQPSLIIINSFANTADSAPRAVFTSLQEQQHSRVSVTHCCTAWS